MPLRKRKRSVSKGRAASRAVAKHGPANGRVAASKTSGTQPIPNLSKPLRRRIGVLDPALHSRGWGASGIKLKLGSKFQGCFTHKTFLKICQCHEKLEFCRYSPSKITPQPSGWVVTWGKEVYIPVVVRPSVRRRPTGHFLIWATPITTSPERKCAFGAKAGPAAWWKADGSVSWHFSVSVTVTKTLFIQVGLILHPNSKYPKRSSYLAPRSSYRIIWEII